ncbi:MAG: TRC40/GET3/ArsA family transport-energizing ATPase [Candidatus Lokiarchaeota archaeon]|nr:TRC40/GET3/ArsA family transport-energizing ATPase [Candidatus Lokiarchaeota archaeon]
MCAKLIFFGGKGGVGKSTTSAATAVYLAKLNPEKKIFLISFDIAHNVGDLFDMEIGDKITQVLPNLWAMEPDADRYTEDYVRDFVEKAKKLMYDLPLVKKMTNLEQYIEESFSAASIPLAVKNSIFFDQILETENDYDIFVVDMPPTGNMVSIFEVPKTTMQVFLKSTLETMDKVLEFVAAMRKLNPANWFRPGANERRKNQAAELLGMLKELDRRNDRIMRMLKTLSSLRFVTIAERPSYEEIRRAADLVKKYVPLEGIVINKLNHDGLDCKFCATETVHQKKYVKLIEETFKDKRIWRTWRVEDEVIGVAKLEAFARSLYEGETFETIIRPVKPSQP